MSVEKVRPIDRYMEILYSLGAVPVLLGALFKLTHSAPFGSANTWLQVGLYTEAIVFLSMGLMYIFAPPHKVDELGNSADTVEETKIIKPVASTLQPMEEMLRAADITPESLQRLSEGFKTLEVNINRISNASSSIIETEEYSKQVKEATLAMHRVNTYYNQLADTSHTLVSTAADAEATQKQMAALAGNLSKLNQMYGGMIAAMQFKPTTDPAK